MHKIGGHVSASGGVDKAIERAAGIGANCVQIFSGSPRVWQRPLLESIDVTKVAAKQQELHVSPIFTHALYLLNLASENQELVQKSVKAISFDLQFDAKLNGAGVVVHVGSHQGRGWEAVRDQVAKEIGQLLATAPRNSQFLIENAAGQNGKIGGELEEIRWLLDTVAADQLGWCFDTCHGFAGGYYLGKNAPDVLPEEGWLAKSALAEIERLELWSALKCVHVNDSRDPFGSGRDRHANLGEGNIATEDLGYFLNHDLINDKPFILEVPGVEKEGPDAENIQRLKKIVGEQ
jgi:deoxyribonuclease IV